MASHPSEFFNLTGQVALVTGASSGIGAHLAGTLAKAGAKVVLCARRTDRLEALVSEIEAAGGTAMAAAMDVTDKATIAAAFDAAEAAYGTATIVLNNAGVGSGAPAIDTTDEIFDFNMDVNVKGVLHVAQEAAKRMLAAGVKGSIVNTASIAGLGAAENFTAYGTAKAAVVHMTKIMALEWFQQGIRVNALCPGYFITDLNEEMLTTPAGQAMLKRVPPGRSGELHELDAPTLMLVSPASSFVTGVALPVDGGHSVAMRG